MLAEFQFEWVNLMEVVSFIDIEETENDLIISFALDAGNGYIKTLLLHRQLIGEFLMPEEERGTKVSLEDFEIADEHLNTLESVFVKGTVMNIKARFCSHKINLRKISGEEIEQIRHSLEHHNFDNKFTITFI